MKPSWSHKKVKWGEDGEDGPQSRRIEPPAAGRGAKRKGMYRAYVNANAEDEDLHFDVEKNEVRGAQRKQTMYMA